MTILFFFINCIMKPENILIIGILAYFLFRKGAGVLSGSGFSIVGRPGFQLLGAKPTGISFLITIPVKNSSGVPIPLGRFEGALYYGSSFLSPVVLQNPIVIQSGAVTDLRLTGAVNPINLKDELLSILETGNLWQNLTLNGRMYYGDNLSIPINYNLSE